MAPPFRADHIGSLLRPQSLLDARSNLASPSQMYSLDISAAIKQAEAKAVREVVEAQKSKGIRPITDGEYARHIYYGGFFEKFDGFTVRPDLPIPDAFRTGFPTTTGLAKMRPRPARKSSAWARSSTGSPPTCQSGWPSGALYPRCCGRMPRLPCRPPTNSTYSCALARHLPRNRATSRTRNTLPPWPSAMRPRSKRCMAPACGTCRSTTLI
jgi:hypothetical protein